jgi:hypothetical protein
MLRLQLDSHITSIIVAFNGHTTGPDDREKSVLVRLSDVILACQDGEVLRLVTASHTIAVLADDGAREDIMRRVENGQ